MICVLYRRCTKQPGQQPALPAGFLDTNFQSILDKYADKVILCEYL
jgi:hypothetical protein